MAGSLVAEVLERPTGGNQTSFRKSVVLGIATAAIGRRTGLDYITASMPVLDTLRGNILRKQSIKEYTGYTTGVAIAYSDKIYEALSPHVSMLETAGEFVKNLF